MHTPPVVPHVVPPAPPPTHVPKVGEPDVVSQQPVLHASVLPPTTQVLEQECVVMLQAWFAGQSEVCAQPHMPPVQTFVPVHGPQAAPAVPHAELLLPP